MDNHLQQDLSLIRRICLPNQPLWCREDVSSASIDGTEKGNTIHQTECHSIQVLTHWEDSMVRSGAIPSKPVDSHSHSGSRLARAL